jgi:hypothetical protein
MTLVDGGRETAAPRRGVGDRANANDPAIEWANARSLIRGSFEQSHPSQRGPAVNWTTVAGPLVTRAIVVAATPAAPSPAPAHAKNGDTHGWDQTVFYHSGAPFIWDRGRELGMTNRLQQVPG